MLAVIRRLVVPLALVVLSAACGGGLSADEQELAGVLATDLEAFGRPPMSDAERGCVAEDMVSDLGAGRLNEMGFVVRDGASATAITRENQAAFLDSFGEAFSECIDVRDLFTRDADLTPEAQCAIDQLSEDDLADGYLIALKSTESTEDDIARLAEIELKFATAEAECAE